MKYIPKNDQLPKRTCAQDSCAKCALDFIGEWLKYL